MYFSLGISWKKSSHLPPIPYKRYSVLQNRSQRGLFKDPFIHYVRYQGKSILASKGTSLLMSKWKDYLVNCWQCHFYVWSQPRSIYINQLSNHSLDWIYDKIVYLQRNGIQSQQISMNTIGFMARLLMFSHMNLLSLAIGDPISVPTEDMLIGLYVLTSENRRGICVNRYNPCNRIDYQNERIGVGAGGL